MSSSKREWKAHITKPLTPEIGPSSCDPYCSLLEKKKKYYMLR